jgi:hypothetical protein
LNFHKRKQDVFAPEIWQIVTIRNEEFREFYIVHPDPNIDLACINITSIWRPELNIFYKNLFIEMFSDFSEEDLLPGIDVWFIGYPENRFDNIHNLPLLRRGYIASIPKVDFNGKKQFVIDAQVFKGSSGSPVFAALKGNFKFLGVVGSTMIRNEQLQAVPTGVALGVQQMLGLGIVIKATVVKELIEHAIKEIEKSLEKVEN